MQWPYMKTRPYKYYKCISKVPTKSHGLVGKFPNRQKGNKTLYDSIYDYLHRLNENIGEPIATIYVIEITGMTTRYKYNRRALLQNHT